MMRRLALLGCLGGLAACVGPAGPDITRVKPLVSNPGLCNATPAEQELADLVLLTPTGLESHAAQCRFDRALRFLPGRGETVRATCGTGAETWQTDLQLDTNVAGRVFITPLEGRGTTLPDFYFSCR